MGCDRRGGVQSATFCRSRAVGATGLHDARFLAVAAGWWVGGGEVVGVFERHVLVSFGL